MSTTDKPDADASTTSSSDEGDNIVMTTVVTTQYITMGLESTDTPSTALPTDTDASSTSNVLAAASSSTPTLDASTTATNTSSTSDTVFPSSSTDESALSSTDNASSTAPLAASPIATLTASVMPTDQLRTSEQTALSNITPSLPPIILSPTSTLATLPSSVTQAVSRLDAISSGMSSMLTMSSTTAAGTAVSSPSSLPEFADPHKQAVVGGIAGAMGGSVFIAVLLLLCFCDRRKARRKHRAPSSVLYESRPPLTQAQSSFAPVPYFATAKRSSIKSFRTADGNLIHIDVDQFSRPFAEQEGWRESLGPRRLQVMNPDRSLPATPNTASDRMTGFMSGRYKISPSNSDGKSLRSTPPKLPMIHIDESPSEEYLAPRDSPAWSKKTPILQTTPMITRDYPAQEVARNARNMQPPMRTPATIANVLYAFQSKSSQNVIGTQPENVRYSTTQYSPSSSRRVSSITDPFELESPQMQQGPRFIMQKPPRAVLTSDLKPFEGT